MNWSWSWILQAAGALVLLAAALAVIVKGVGFMATMLRKVGEFLEDWRGEEARPGYHKRPGVMERLVALEEGQATTARQVNEIVHEVKPNSGTSLKDQVTRIEATTVPPEDRPSQ